MCLFSFIVLTLNLCVLAEGDNFLTNFVNKFFIGRLHLVNLARFRSSLIVYENIHFEWDFIFFKFNHCSETKLKLLVLCF